MATILIVEDSPDNMKVFRTLLTLKRPRSWGWWGRRAGSTPLSGPSRPLVLMDIQLPEQDGFELLQDIRRDARAVRAVALTAHAMAGDRERAIEARVRRLHHQADRHPRIPHQVARALGGEQVTTRPHTRAARRTDPCGSGDWRRPSPGWITPLSHAVTLRPGPHASHGRDRIRNSHGPAPAP